MTWKEVNNKLTPKPGLQCLVLKRGNSEKRIYFASKCCVPCYQLWSYNGQNSIPNEHLVDPKVADELGSARLAWEKNVPSNLHILLGCILNWQLSHKVYFNYAKWPLVRCIIAHAFLQLAETLISRFRATSLVLLGRKCTHAHLLNKWNSPWFHSALLRFSYPFLFLLCFCLFACSFPKQSYLSTISSSSLP